MRSVACLVVALGLGMACGGVGEPSAPPRQPAPAPAPEVAPAVEGPEDVVRGVYAPYLDANAVPRDPWLAVASADLARAWGTAEQEAVDACGVPPIRESDVVVDAQDYAITNVRVKAQIDGERADVTARFDNFGKKREVRYALVREGGVWRIDDIFPSGDSLRKRILDTVVAGDGC